MSGAVHEAELDAPGIPLRRRAFLSALICCSVALAVLPAVVRKTLTLGACASPAQQSAVISFHMDQPYLDVSGTAMPYHPPRGLRSGSPVGELSEEAFRRTCCYA